MPISQHRAIPAECATCGATLAGSFWSLVDLGERPDLLAALLAGQLNQSLCAACGATGVVVPLVIHAPTVRAVYLVPDAGTPDAALREAAQASLHVLVAALPAAAHAAYLDEVRVVSALDDVRRGLQRARPSRTAARVAPDGEAAWHTGLAAVLAADSPSELQAELARHPALSSEAADGWLARQQRMASSNDAALARAIALVRQAIADMRRGAIGGDDGEAAGLNALLAARDAARVADVVADHPALVGAAPRARLGEWIDEAARDGDLVQAHTLLQLADALERIVADARQPATIAVGVASLAGAAGSAEQLACVRQFPGLCSEPGRLAVQRAIAAGQVPAAAWPVLCTVCGA